MAPLHITEQPNPSHIKRSYSSTVAQHATLYIGPRARPGTQTGPQREIGQIAVRRDRAARARIPPHTVQQATHSTFPRDHRSQRYAFYVCRDERDSFRFSCAPVTSALMRAPWNTGAHLSCRRSPPHSWRHSYGQHISTSSSVHRWTSRPSKA